MVGSNVLRHFHFMGWTRCPYSYIYMYVCRYVCRCTYIFSHCYESLVTGLASSDVCMYVCICIYGCRYTYIFLVLLRESSNGTCELRACVESLVMLPREDACVHTVGSLFEPLGA